MSAGSAGSAGELRFGATEVPAAERDALRRAVRLEWVTMAYMVTCVVLVYLVMGSSQAMKAAWIEDLLAFIPPIAFLIATRVVRRPPDADFPHGRHRAVAGGHLAAAVALLTVGLLLIVDSASGLLAAEHPPIGTTRILGHTLWAGWPMIAVMVYTAIGPVLIARAKMPLAEQLHDRILFADADMQKADWMTATGSIAGILGIGLGLWWADSVVAIAIAGSIVHDGWRNLRHAIRGLMDARARTTDMTEVHPLVERVQRTVEEFPGVAAARTRVRDVGHLLDVDGHVVAEGAELTPERIRDIVDDLHALDWKIGDVVLMPVRALPDVPDPREDPAER